MSHHQAGKTGRGYLKMRYLLILLVAFTLPAQAEPYDENANADLDIQTALKESRNNDKFVLLEFGANWCPDCKVLAKQMLEAPLKELIENNFIVVNVDIGEGEKNLHLIKKYGNVTDRGIPSIVVLDKDNNILLGTLSGQLANARSMGKDELYHFFASVINKAELIQVSNPPSRGE